MAKPKSVAQILVDNQEDVVKVWTENILALPGNRTLELMTGDQLKKQVFELAKTLTTAFSSEVYDDIERPEFADSTTMLRDISATRAEQGFTPSETAFFILSLRDALLQFMQDEFGDEPELFNTEVSRMNKIIDNLALLTFESFSKTREDIISRQSESMMELTTPAVKMWDQILLLSIVGVIDTKRAQMIIETLLQAIVDTESRVVLIDVTGVPVLDTRVAQHIIKTVAAAKMLGTEAILTGISPDAAQTLTKLDIDISSIRTAGTLRAGVQESFNFIGLKVVSGD